MIYIKNPKYNTLIFLLNYSYPGRVSVIQDIIQSLFRAYKRLKIFIIHKRSVRSINILITFFVDLKDFNKQSYEEIEIHTKNLRE